VAILDHLLVLTDDIDATRDFWCEALDLEVGERPPLEFPGYWLYGADGSPCVHVAERAAYEAHVTELGLPLAPGPIEHVAFDVPDHREAVARIQRMGISATSQSISGRMGSMRQLFVEDPNGVKIEMNTKEQP
jgi:catechol 2,3-dioxygenase-like lactoylglutathione lyase family enzyme